MKQIVLSLVVAFALTGCGDITWLPTPKAVPVITTNTLPDAPFNLTYSQTLSATGGTAPYTWSLQSGTFPPGLTLNSNGTITSSSSTPPAGNTANSGTYTVTISVSDSQTPHSTGSKNFSIFAPTTGRMYDATHVVYAENLFPDPQTPPQTIGVSLGNQGGIAHSIQAIAANYDTTTGSEIAGSSTTLSIANLAAGAATTTPVTANIPAAAINTTVNNWRIKSVTLQ